MPFDGMQRAVPGEFCVFRQGLNETEKGTFLFDETAAELVMSHWTERKIDLSMDYEHMSLHDPPLEAPNSATRWIPQVRNGELWATEVKWTDRAGGYLLAGEYRYFSPAFEFEEKSRRVTKLINIALTNNPAMRGITPLVAASTNAKETRMDFEKLYNELKAANATLTAELSATSAKVTELTAQLANKKKDPEEEEEEKEKLTAALSLPMSARARERLSAANELSLFRANVRSITGEASDARAIGVLTAWKGGHGEVAKLSSRVAELEGEKLKTEFDQLVAVEGKDKVAPAEQAEFKTKMLSITGGKLCAETITATRACLSITGPKISTTAIQQPAGAQILELHPTQLHIAKICGRDPKDLMRKDG
jgi:phage I-like protein